MSRAVLALDVGTSSARASLYDTRGRHVRGAAARVTYAPHVTADGGAEFDADGLFESVCAALDQVLHRRPKVEIAAVATSTFWHSLIGLDGADTPLTPVYLWMDARSRQDAAALRQELDERAVHARVGCGLHWSYWPAKLRWLERTQSARVAQVRTWVSFGELLLRRLTGQTGVSVSMASGTGLLNAHTCAWDEPLLQHLELDPSRLATISSLQDTSQLAASWARQWPALRGVPWVQAVGDGAASNVGANCTTAERAALMVGTSGAERVVWAPEGDFRVPPETWCYRVDERRAVVGGAINDGGSLFDWLRHTLRLPALRTLETALVDMPPDAHGLTVLPFWAGERSPGWADDARGAIVGLRLHTQPLDIVRAALEAVALRFVEIDRALLRAMPDGQEVIATGGALLHSPAWLQIMADALGRPVFASAEREASSRGVCLLALDTLGQLGAPLEALRPVTRARYEPIPAHTQRYQAAAERQRALYDQLVAR